MSILDLMTLPGLPVWDDVLSIADLIPPGQLAVVQYTVAYRDEPHVFYGGRFAVRHVALRTAVEHRITDEGISLYPFELEWPNIVRRAHVLFWSVSPILADPWSQTDAKTCVLDECVPYVYFARGPAPDGVQRVVRVDHSAFDKMEVLLQMRGPCTPFGVCAHGGIPLR